MAKGKTFQEMFDLTPLEQEAITLKAVLGMINDMVNHETMTFLLNDPHSEIRFKSMTHKAYFNILLVDFLSIPGDFFKEQKTYLERLGDICENPLFGDDYIANLKKAVSEFSSWLSQTVVVEKRWFSSLDLSIDLSIKRETFIIICGNLSKHNFTQQTRQARKLAQVMKDNGQSISLDRCLIALEEFYEQFAEDIIYYHASTIAEFLNNIRWGIYVYAGAERERSVVNWFDEKLNLQNYKYEYPTGIVSLLGQTYYWNLMNDVIRPPYIPRFEATKYLKMRY